MEPSALLTVTDLAAELEITPRHIFRLIDTKVIEEPSTKVGRMRVWNTVEADKAKRAYHEYRAFRKHQGKKMTTTIISMNASAANLLSGFVVGTDRREWLSLAEVASVFNITPAQLYPFTRESALDSFGVQLKGARAGKSLVFRPSAVLDFLQRIKEVYGLRQFVAECDKAIAEMKSEMQPETSVTP